MENWQEILKSIDWPTDALCLDFETYFDKDYALPKMSTVEYVADPRFQFTGLSVKVLDGSNAKFFGGSEVDLAIRLLQKAYGKCLHNCTLIVANAKFDILILLEKFGITPPFVIDVQDLGRYYDARMSQKIKDLAKTFNLPAKGDTNRFKGLHWGDMGYPMRKELKEYANRDVDIEVDLFKILLPEIDNPMFELKLARHTLKMYLNPMVVLDTKKANDLVDKMDAEVASILKAVGCTPKELRGEKSFVALLAAALPAGEEIPFKKGKNKMILALAKDDDACKELLNHPVEAVVNLVQARLGVKSWPLHINRVRRLVAQSSVCNGKLRMPLKYYAGHTGRWGGEEKINPQNFGGKGRGKAINKLIGQVRECLIAPTNYSFLIADSAQIEARVLAWLAEQDDLVQGFANGEDIYSEFASVLFASKVYKPKSDDNTPEAKIASIRRGFGKDAILGCVAFDSPILTDRGWKSIQDVDIEDRLWDGGHWVHHDGVVKRGKKNCIEVNNIWMTPEHEILNSDEWTTAAELSISSQKSGINSDNLLSRQLFTGNVGGLSPSNVVAPVVEYLLRRETIWSLENLHVVMSVLKRHPAKLRVIRHSLENLISPDCLIEFVQSLADVKQNHISIMVNEVLECGPNGSRIESLFLNTWQHYRDMITGILTSIGLTTIEDMNPAICDSLPESRILETADILYSGDYKTFQAGQMLVSNCGYGMGKDTFFERCMQNDDLRPLFDSGQYDKSFIKRLIDTYRTKYTKIPELWGSVERAFKHVIKYSSECTAGHNDCLNFSDAGDGTVAITLPSERRLLYHDAHLNKDGSICYRGGNQKFGLWGGSIIENIVQSISRDLLGLWILETEANGIPVVLHCHDEVVGCVPDDKIESCGSMIKEIMTTPPLWGQDLPLATEVCVAKGYKK